MIPVVKILFFSVTDNYNQRNHNTIMENLGQIYVSVLHVAKFFKSISKDPPETHTRYIMKSFESLLQTSIYTEIKKNYKYSTQARNFLLSSLTRLLIYSILFRLCFSYSVRAGRKKDKELSSQFRFVRDQRRILWCSSTQSN